MSMNTWQPTGFSAGEFARMQQDAERRGTGTHLLRAGADHPAGGGDHPASGGGAGLAFAVVGFMVSI